MEKLSNSKNRWKNPYTYIGIVGIVLTACGVDASTFTTWGALFDSLEKFISNPFLIGTVIMALVGNYNNPTTSGLRD